MASKYANTWQNEDGKIIKSETHPGQDFYPVYAKSRVQGEKYEYYTAQDGSPAWVAAANRAMADASRANFESKR